MRTSKIMIDRVAHWLERFTLAELVFVLQESARMYPLDKFRVRKIGLAVRETFGGDQSDDDIRMLIEDLSDVYSQTRPMMKAHSLSSIAIKQNDHLLIPFRSSCPVCCRSLNENNAKQKRIRIYCDNGAVVMGTMFTLYCNHQNKLYPSSTNNSSFPITIFPNFIRSNNCNTYTHESLYFGRYVYVSGDFAVERSIIEKFVAHIVHHDISMMGYASYLNQLALNTSHRQLVPVDRRILTNIMHTFLVIQLHLGFGYSDVSVPLQSHDFNQWSWDKFPHLLSCFIYLWINHRSIIGSCGDHCSKCLVVDGHQKTRRRICLYKDVKVDTEEFKDITIGCCRTPIRSSRYCELHNQKGCNEAPQEVQILGPKKKNLRKIFYKYKNKSFKNDNHLNATSCRTLKARSDGYLKKCTRSFGLISTVYNCRIIASFSELYRCETLKEIINLFAVTYRVAGKLAPTLVYDDGCHLLKYVKNHIDRDLPRTAAMNTLDSTPISVDRSHFRNHVGSFCRQTMNPDKNPLLNNVNTQCAEQTFSWLRHYANIISSMGHLRAPLFTLILFNLKNLSVVNKSPSTVFDINSVCPKVDAVSLCHIEPKYSNTTVSTKIESTDANQVLHYTEYLENYDLPKGTIDWDSKLFEILNKK